MKSNSLRVRKNLDFSEKSANSRNPNFWKKNLGQGKNEPRLMVNLVMNPDPK